MENQVAVQKEKSLALAVEQAVTAGNLALLNPEQKLFYYNKVCESMGLNPLTRPFDFIMLNGKLVLYAKKDATDQLRKINAISITITARETVSDLYVVSARGVDKTGRTDESIGAVSIAGLKGDLLANAYMKAETKAKRRVTLSIGGLGLTDESELETIPEARAQLAGGDMAAKSSAQVESLKVGAGVAAAPVSAVKEPEVLPAKKMEEKKKPGRRPDGAKAEDAPPPIPAAAKAKPVEVSVEPPLGATIVPFGFNAGKSLDALDEKELQDLARNIVVQPGNWSGPRGKDFIEKFKQYAGDPQKIAAFEEPPGDIPPPVQAADGEEDPGKFFETPGFEDDGAQAEQSYETVAFDRLRNAKNMDALKVAWIELNKDAKDPNKINLPGISAVDSADFTKRAVALRDECKKALAGK